MKQKAKSNGKVCSKKCFDSKARSHRMGKECKFIKKDRKRSLIENS